MGEEKQPLEAGSGGLPPELWRSIVEHCAHEDRLNVSNVNKFFGSVVSSVRRGEQVTVTDDPGRDDSLRRTKLYRAELSMEIKLQRPYSPEHLVSFTGVMQSVPQVEKIAIIDEYKYWEPHRREDYVMGVMADIKQSTVPSLRHFLYQTKETPFPLQALRQWSDRPPITTLALIQEYGGGMLDFRGLEFPHLRIAIFHGVAAVDNLQDCLRFSQNIEVLYLGVHASYPKAPSEGEVLKLLRRLRILYWGVEGSLLSMKDIGDLLDNLPHLKYLGLPCLGDDTPPYYYSPPKLVFNGPSEAMIQCIKACRRYPNVEELCFTTFPSIMKGQFPNMDQAIRSSATQSKAQELYSEQLRLYMTRMAAAIGPALPDYCIGFGLSLDTHPLFPRKPRHCFVWRSGDGYLGLEALAVCYLTTDSAGRIVPHIR